MLPVVCIQSCHQQCDASADLVKFWSELRLILPFSRRFARAASFRVACHSLPEDGRIMVFSSVSRAVQLAVAIITADAPFVL